MDIYGKIPKSLEQSLSKLNVVVSDVQVAGDDIDIMIDKNGVTTVLYAIYVGNGKWVIDELFDDANLFPNLEEGDSIGLDAITKQFVNSINSSAIFSFNPLGRVKYGIKDKVEGIKDVGRRIKDWATDKLYAEDAENFIRKNGPYRRTFTDSRDGVTRTKKDYNASKANVGKIEQMGKMGHYKVLTGNPQTQDFQVWHLYKNGDKIRCLDVKTGLKPQEAQWVYDNNLPKSWSEADWNPEGEVPEKASKIEVGETPEQTETTQEESNVHDFIEDYYNEEDNVEDIGEDEDWFTSENVGTVEEDNVTEEPKKKRKSVKASVINTEESNVIESSYYTEEELLSAVEEDNVTEEPKKKSKYNGCNVTGCAQPDGTVVMANYEEDNVIDTTPVFSKLEDFIRFVNADRKHEFNDNVVAIIKDLCARLVKIPLDIRRQITRQSSNNLMLNFNNTKTNPYTATINFYNDRISITCPAYSEYSQEEILNKIKNSLDDLAKK